MREPSGRAIGAGLVVLALLLAALRAHTAAEPLEHNLTTYAVVGHALGEGARLYTDIWDHKPPAIYASYLLAERAVGYGPGQVLLLGIVTGWLTLLGVFTLAARGPGGRAAGLLAAGLYVVASGTPELRANQPDSEAFLNATLVWGVALLAGARGDLRRVAAAGALFALASLYKHNAVLVLAALAAGRLAQARGAAAAWREVALLAAVVGAAWLVVGGWFAAQGRHQDAWSTLIEFNREYAGSVVGNLLLGLAPDQLLPREAVGRLAPLLLGVGSGLALLWSRGDPRAGLLTAWIAGTYATIAAPGMFYFTYYALWLPPLAVGTAWAIAHAPWRGRVAAAAIAVVAGLQAPAYLWSPETWCARKYPGSFSAVFTTLPRVAAELDALLPAEATFFAWDEGGGLYFHARRTPPTSVFWVGKLVGSRPGPRARAERTLRQLEARPPALVVQNRLLPWPGEHPVVRWVEARYEPTDRSPSPVYRFWKRREAVTAAPRSGSG